MPLLLSSFYSCSSIALLPSFTPQIKTLQEDLKKANADIVANADAIEKMASGEIKTLNVRTFSFCFHIYFEVHHIKFWHVTVESV